MKKYTPYFIYNGIDSREMGVIITSMPPVTAQKKEWTRLPYRGAAVPCIFMMVHLRITQKQWSAPL